MTPAQVKRTATATLGIPAAILIVIYVANWAVERFASNEYVSRAEYQSDLLRRAQFDSSQAATLRRIDARVADIYCGRLPTEVRAGCR